MNGRNVPEEVAAAVRRSGGSPINLPMSSGERDIKIQIINDRSDQSLNKPGENFRVALLSKMYNQSKKRATELGIKSLEGGTKNSAIPLKAHGQQAARVYQAISSLLYSSINMYKSEELEKFITRMSRALPGSIFDLAQWQAAIDVAREVRSRGIGKDTWAGTGPNEVWMARTPGPWDTGRSIPSRGDRFDAVELGTEWRDDEEHVDMGTMRFGAGLEELEEEEEEEEEEEKEEEAGPLANNNWVQSPPRSAAQPQAALPHRVESPPKNQQQSRGTPALEDAHLGKLLEELHRLEGSLQRKGASKNQILSDAGAARQALLSAQGQIAQLMRTSSQAVSKDQQLRELAELRAESTKPL